MEMRDAHRAGAPVLVSACLLGIRTRFDGGHCRRREVLALAADRVLIPVCPEQLGGLPTPRVPAEIEAGTGQDVLAGRTRVIGTDGSEVTANFVRGAEAAARIAGQAGARRAILKEGSPSCGLRRITRAGRDVAGPGVTAALLRRRGLQVEGLE